MPAGRNYPTAKKAIDAAVLLHWWIHLCRERIRSCLMRLQSNFILKNSPNKNFRVNAILIHWLSTFPTSVESHGLLMDYYCSIQPRPSVRGWKMSLQDCLPQSLNGHQTASAVNVGLPGACMRHERSCKPDSGTYCCWKFHQGTLLPASPSAQNWVSPQPPYCASSPVISIPEKKMLSISWKLTPRITSLRTDGKPMFKPQRWRRGLSYY